MPGSPMVRPLPLSGVVDTKKHAEPWPQHLIEVLPPSADHLTSFQGPTLRSRTSTIRLSRQGLRQISPDNVPVEGRSHPNLAWVTSGEVAP